VVTGRLAWVLSGQGQNMIFTLFAANVIGGISSSAGRGTMFGTLTGVVILVALVVARVTAGEAEGT